jgi:hypothetical protein
MSETNLFLIGAKKTRPDDYDVRQGTPDGRPVGRIYKYSHVPRASGGFGLFKSSLPWRRTAAQPKRAQRQRQIQGAAAASGRGLGGVGRTSSVGGRMARPFFENRTAPLSSSLESGLASPHSRTKVGNRGLKR